MYECSSATHVGLVRANNEDCCDALPDLGVFVIADGLGGETCGERASKITVETLIDAAREAGPGLSVDTIYDAVELANRRIWFESENDPLLRGMGTTVTAALLQGDAVDIVNAGDSRAYRFREGKLDRLTLDHSFLRHLADAFGGTEDDYRHHRDRNKLTKAVGADERVGADRVNFDFAPGDILLLSSDGLHGFVPAESISRVLGTGETLARKARGLIDETLKRGAPDNVTVVLVSHAASE